MHVSKCKNKTLENKLTVTVPPTHLPVTSPSLHRKSPVQMPGNSQNMFSYTHLFIIIDHADTHNALDPSYDESWVFHAGATGRRFHAYLN